MSGWLAFATMPIDPLMGFLVDAALKGALVYAAGAALVVLLHRRTAATRHLTWSLTVAGVLGVPVLSACLPARVLPLAVRRGGAVAVRDAGARTGSAGPQAQRTVSGPAFALPLEDSRASGFRFEAPDGVRRLASNPAPAPRVVPEGRWAFWVWAAGAVLFLLPTAAGLLSLWRLGRSSSPVPDGPAQRRLAELAGTLGVKRPVRLVQNPQRAMPMTWGLWRPYILLPAASESWTAERLEMVLMHELGHVRRGDFATGLLGRLACALHWFNPLAWIARARLRVEQEKACDDLALGQGLDPLDYADHLLEVVTLGVERAGGRSLASAMASPREIERRLRSILDPARPRAARPPARRQVALAALAAACLVAPLASGRLGWTVATAADHTADHADATDPAGLHPAPDREPRSARQPYDRAAALEPGDRAHSQEGHDRAIALQADAPRTDRAAGGQEAPAPGLDQAIARIQEKGGRVTRDETKPSHPVMFVTLAGERVTDADLALLTGMNDLKILTLQGTRITGDGLDRLNALTSLSGLTLQQTKMTDELVDHVTRLSNLRTLSIHGAKISGGRLDHLTRMDKLHGLTLIDVQITGDLVEHAKPTSGLRTLSISGSVITDALADYLAELAGLGLLNLSDSTVTDSALSRLKGLTHLRFLLLDGTRITDAGLEHLRGMTELVTLNLSRTEITDAGLSHLEGMIRLRNLNVEGTKVTEAGVKRLREGIPQVAAVPFILPPARALPGFPARRAVAPAVRGPGAAGPPWGQAIARIYEMGGTVTRDETKPERPVISATLSGTKVTDADLAVLTGLSDLRHLTLTGTTITGEGLDRLTGLTNWHILNLYQTEVPDALVDHVTRLTGVTRMTLMDSSITFAGLDRMARKSNINSLNLWIVRITGDAAEPPKTDSKLRDVQLTRTVITDALLDYLAEMRGLTTLGLAECMVTDAGFSRLKGLTNLRFLRLNGTKITDAGLEPLEGMTQLFGLNLSRTDVTDAGLAHLKGLVRLRILELAGTQVTEAGVMELQKALPDVKVKR
jgi:beta-lactamase regulating signal transducer with metallopeptidase domain/Leucine-rich repeat (LRR) protein